MLLNFCILVHNFVFRKPLFTGRQQQAFVEFLSNQLEVLGDISWYVNIRCYGISSYVGVRKSEGNSYCHCS